MDFPMAVAVKNVIKGIPKCPHVIPAKSNNGFGTEAQIKTVIKPYFCKLYKLLSLFLILNFCHLK